MVSSMADSSAGSSTDIAYRNGRRWRHELYRSVKARSNDDPCAPRLTHPKPEDGRNRWRPKHSVERDFCTCSHAIRAEWMWLVVVVTSVRPWPQLALAIGVAVWFVKGMERDEDEETESDQMGRVHLHPLGAIAEPWHPA